MSAQHTVGVFRQISTASQASWEQRPASVLNPGTHVGRLHSKNHSLTAKKVIKWNSKPYLDFSKPRRGSQFRVSSNDFSTPPAGASLSSPLCPVSTLQGSWTVCLVSRAFLCTGSELGWQSQHYLGWAKETWWRRKTWKFPHPLNNFGIEVLLRANDIFVWFCA